MLIHFTKMHGLGNDFVVINGIKQQILLAPEQIRELADRHFGIGFDQLLLLEAPAVDSNADFSYRIFNADGGEVAQCGNGARCFARFVRDQKLSDQDQLLIDTNSGQLQVKFDQDGLITVNMGIPKHLPEEIPIKAVHVEKFYSAIVDGVERAFGAVSVGNPHAVLQVNDIDHAPVATLGPKLENHTIFPERANIGFMQIINRQHIKLRVYERGAAETLACGSGACAAVVIGIEQNLLDAQVKVELSGGSLDISWLGHGQPVFMDGPAVSVFEGTIEL
jgi:diaminopimelate epimerase